MPYAADLHVHSCYSRATSRACNLEGLYCAAQRKGVRVVGTGDFTHPQWSQELAEKLVPSSACSGLYRLKEDAARSVIDQVPPSCRGPVDFMLTAEISSIYKRDDVVRKVHTLVNAPDLRTVQRLHERLDSIGNIASDGRPILGLDPRDLLEIVLEINPGAYVIPAHIWTPWFSMLGAKSGFDSPDGCFGELRKYVFAVETGLSSDPPMNWRVGSLDDFCLVSNSDLHSPDKLGRNATLFHGEPDYFTIRDALRTKDPDLCGGTLDLFPEEGKYHFDGHRKCGVCLEPEESLAIDNICPVCGKPLTLGVRHRSVALADRPKGGAPESALPCHYIIPLKEMLAEIYGVGPGSKKVGGQYERLLNLWGPELYILRNADLEELQRKAPVLLPEAVRRLRKEEVIRRPGFDGQYGVIRVFREGEKDLLQSQGTMASVLAGASRSNKPSAAGTEKDNSSAPDDSIAATRSAGSELPLFASGMPRPAETAQTVGEAAQTYNTDEVDNEAVPAGLTDTLTPEQQKVVTSAAGKHQLVVAGPGTGKTRTLICRIAYLLHHRQVQPKQVLALTFTNKAVSEMQDRIRRMVPGNHGKAVAVSTFHAFALSLLREHTAEAGAQPGFTLSTEEDCTEILKTDAGLQSREATELVHRICTALRSGEEGISEVNGYDQWQTVMAGRNMVCLDAVVPLAVSLLRQFPQIKHHLPYTYIFVDEYQDVNAAQYRLIRELVSHEAQSICVIGDPDQAIYGFRGGDRKFFLDFQADFPGSEMYHLTDTFRNTPQITTVAQTVISGHQTQLSAEIQARGNSSGANVQFFKAPTAAAEAEFITHEIEKLVGGTALFSMDSGRVGGNEEDACSFRDIAVLVRMRALVAPLCKALRRLGLPVQATGEQRPGEREDIRRLIKNLESGLTSDDFNRGAGTVLAEFAPQVHHADKTAYETCLRLAAPYHESSLRTFIDSLITGKEGDDFDAKAECVSVMTLHAAKGLEFPVVFIPACEDGVLPYRSPTATDDTYSDEEEERRLFYVGITRARCLLYLSYARKRMLFGKMRDNTVSPFLEKLSSARLEYRTMPAQKPRPKSWQPMFKF